MDNDGGLAAYEAQQAEREADHEERRARMNPTAETSEESVEEKPKPKSRSRSRAKSKTSSKS
jgi:hypothetical protein